MDALDAEGMGFHVTDPNGDQGKDGKEGKGNPDAKPKRVVLRAPKFKAEDLQSTTRGIPALLRAFEKVKFNGSEEHDLAKAMRTYRMWAHTMFKFAPFDELCQKIEKEGSTFAMKEYMTSLREERDDPTLKAQREAEESRQDIMIDGDDDAAIADAMRRARTPGKDRSKPRAPAISMIHDDEEDAPLDMQFEELAPSQSSKQGGPDIDYKMSPSLERHMPHAQPQRSAPVAAKPARASTLSEEQQARMRANLQRAKRLKAERMRTKRELQAMASGKSFSSDATSPSSEPQKKKARTSEHSISSISSSRSSSPSAPKKPSDSDSQQSESARQDNDKSSSSTKSLGNENSKETCGEIESSEKVNNDDVMMELSDREEDAIENDVEDAKKDDADVEGVVGGINESAMNDVSSMTVETSDNPKQYGVDEIPPSPPTFSQVSGGTPEDNLSATQVRSSLQSQSSHDDDAMTPTQLLSFPPQMESQGEMMPTQVLTESQEMSNGGIDTELAAEMRQGSGVSERDPNKSA